MKLRYERINGERLRVLADGGQVVGEILEHQHMRLRTGRFFKTWQFGGRDYARRGDAGWAALRAATKAESKPDTNNINQT